MAVEIRSDWSLLREELNALYATHPERYTHIWNAYEEYIAACNVGADVVATRERLIREARQRAGV